jgi:hypothetical protein
VVALVADKARAEALYHIGPENPSLTPISHRGGAAAGGTFLHDETLPSYPCPKCCPCSKEHGKIYSDPYFPIARLNALKATLPSLPLTTSIMLRAAELWAQARRRGRPTADPKELDCDVSLAAPALAVGAMVVTENVGHLALFVAAKSWRDIVATQAESFQLRP